MAAGQRDTLSNDTFILPSLTGGYIFFLTLGMNDHSGTAVELIAFAAFIAAIIIVVITLLTSLSGQCSRGTPVLPAIFPCFQER